MSEGFLYRPWVPAAATAGLSGGVFLFDLELAPAAGAGFGYVAVPFVSLWLGGPWSPLVLAAFCSLLDLIEIFWSDPLSGGPDSLLRHALVLVLIWGAAFLLRRLKQLQLWLRRFRLLADSCRQILFLIDRAGTVLSCNQALALHLGMPAGQILGRRLEDLPTSALARQVLEQATLTRRSGEVRRCREDFEGRTFESCLSPVTDARGQVEEVAICSHEITARVAAEEDARRERERFQAQYLGSPVPTFCWRSSNGDLQLIDFNPAALAITDGAIEWLKGAGATSLYAARPQMVSNMKRCLETRKPVEWRTDCCPLAPEKARHLEIHYVFIPPDMVMVHLLDHTEREEARAAVERSRSELKAVLESVEDCIMTLDGEGTICFLNRPLGDIDLQAVGHPVCRYLPSEQAGRFRQTLRRCLEERKVQNLEIRGPGAPPLLYACSMVPEGGAPGRVTCLWRDVTRQRETERELVRSEHRYRELYNRTPATLFSIDRQGRIRAASDHGLQVLGGSRSEIVGQPALDFVSGESRAAFGALLVEIWKEGSVSGLPIQLQSRSGRVIDTLLSAVVEKESGEGSERFLAVLVDISERRQAERLLLNHQICLRNLTSELTLTEQRERRRLAQLLHDEVAQALALAKMELGMLEQELKRGNPRVGRIRVLLDESVRSTRSLISELSPPVLYELGLEAALEWLGEQILSPFGIAWGIENDGKPKPLGEDVRITLFQAARETLVNVVKHARASRVEIRLERAGEQIRITIEDNGVGLGSATPRPRFSTRGGFGLFNIQERLEMLGGSARIGPAGDRGTRIALSAPLVPSTPS